MNLIESMRIALRGLIANKMRSALTMLGIVIGIAAVISLTSIGTGVQSTITTQFESMGTNLLYISPGSSSQSGVRGSAGSAATLTLEDSEALASSPDIPSVAMVAPQVTSFSQIIAGDANVNAQVIGVTPEYEYVHNTSVASGEFITAQQVDAQSLDCILGATTASTLFGDSDPVGQRVKVGRLQMTVTGVLAKKGGTGFGSVDDAVILPITTVQSRMSTGRTVRGSHNVQMIAVKVVNANEMDAAIQQVSAILRERHHIADISGGSDDFTIINMADMMASLQQIMQIFTIFLGFIAGISLLVGGIGIMNIMLVSVTERIREIGIRKAVGAQRRDILVQFLTESAIISFIGGGIGVLAGWGGSVLISKVQIAGQLIPSVMSPTIIVVSLIVSIAIGLFFGVYPANKAAKLDPIEALRHE